MGGEPLSPSIAIDARPAAWYRGTGIGAYTRDLLAHLPLVAGDERYHILWPDDAPAPQLPDGWRVVPMPRRRETERQQLRAWLENTPVDVYHVPQNGIRSPVLPGRARLVVTVHDLIPLVMPETVGHGYCRRFMREVPAAASRASAVIAVSRHTASDVCKLLRVPSERIHVIYAAPDPRFARVAQPQAAELLRARYGLRCPYVLYVGGLNPRKNVADLLYAYSKICRTLWPQRWLVVAGESGRHLPRLQALAELLGIGDYLGWPGHVADTDLPALYSAADFLVYPSLYEGFGLPPLEAMACGTPVLSSDAASLPEVMGEAGLTVAAGDVTALAAALVQLAQDDDLRREMGTRGQHRAAEFSWLEGARQIREVYLRVAAQEDTRREETRQEETRRE